MKISLIQGTIGKPAELSKFLEHLDQQRYRSFELIVVDQSTDERLVPLISNYQDHFPITYLHSDTGLSKARNVGISHITGEVIAFPDDDCWYPGDLLQRISNYFKDYPKIDGFTGRIIDEHGNNCARFATKPAYIKKHNVWERANSNTIFLRANVVTQVGEFDEKLGPGSTTSMFSSDDMDYVIRCVEKRFRIFYDPEITIFHPNTYSQNYEYLSKRAYSYGAGMGFTWRKHQYPTWFAAYYFIRAIGGTSLSLLRGNQHKARFHWQSFRGRWDGWRGSVEL